MEVHPAISTREADVRRLCSQHRVRRLSIFGSAAAPGNEKVGDLDFLVVFLPMAPAERAEHYFSLLAALERLFDLPIDLVESEAVRNPFLKRAIESSQVALYEAA